MASAELLVSEDEDDEGSSGSEDSDGVAAGEKTATEAKQVRKEARKQNRARAAFRSNCALATSVGIWVAIFGYPMYSLVGYRWLFGFRGPLLTRVADEMVTRNLTLRDIQMMEKLRVTCGPLDTGKMRNIAGPFEEAKLVQMTPDMMEWSPEHSDDIWCGLLNGNYLDLWPNVAQLIIFTVYRNTGTTINLAWQGVVGTFFACANMVFMQTLYPAGAAGHLCLKGTAAYGWFFTTIWHRKGQYHWRLASTQLEAQKLYDSCGRQGGLDARAIMDGNGEVVAGWFLNGELREGTLERFKKLHGENCTEGEIVHDSPGYKWWVCMIDVVVVLFLFLISRSARNTIMFGMSWHVSFMMDFMNPQKGVKDCATWSCIAFESVHGAVWRTTVIGALIAIAATWPLALCFPISHFRNLYEDSLGMSHAVMRIWKESMAYLNGRSITAKRFQIETQIVNLSENFTRAQEDADGAWWETFDHGRAGATRRLLQEYDTQTSDIRDMMNCVRGCVLHEDFKGNHARFTDTMHSYMEKVQVTSEDLMFAVLAACKDGRISREEGSGITEFVDKVKEAQRSLVRAFHEASPDVSMDLAEENIYAFALSLGARKITDFAERIVSLSNKQDSTFALHKNMFLELLKSLRDGWLATWSPKRMCDREHLKFAIRNLISISLMFIFSYFVPSGSVFVQYSSTMAGTLTLLIRGDGTHQLGSMIYKNTQRLLGVVLGKVLPIIITWVVLFFPCLSNARFIIQAFSTAFYVYIFTYIYYVSSMWGYVGCLIAGFGVYQLLVPCSADPVETFQYRYQEIGSVVFAIFVQGIVHGLSSRRAPTELQADAVRSLSQAFLDGFRAFFASDLAAMQAAAREADTRLASCKALLPECDPKLKAWTCGEKDFKYNLCAQVISDLDHTLGELNLMIVAAKDWVPNEAVKGDASDEVEDREAVTTGVLETLNSRPAMKIVQEELMHSLSNTLELFQALIEGDDSQDIEYMRAAMELEAAPDLYKQLAGLRYASTAAPEQHELTNDLRARLTIAVRALENSERHLYKITERCLKDFPV